MANNARSAGGMQCGFFPIGRMQGERRGTSDVAPVPSKEINMIRTILVGAVLGFIGKKLYDNGSLDPLIAKASERAEGFADALGVSPTKSKATPASTNA
jgi:hypothetical protein